MDCFICKIERKIPSNIVYIGGGSEALNIKIVKFDHKL